MNSNKTSTFASDHYPFPKIIRPNDSASVPSKSSLNDPKIPSKVTNVPSDANPKSYRTVQYSTEKVTTKYLPPKPEGREGMMNVGIISCAIEPTDFYIFPLKSWECACKSTDPKSSAKQTKSGNCDEHEQFPSEISKAKASLTAFNEMSKELCIYADNCGTHPDHYETNDLVALRLETVETSGGQSHCWFRAVITHFESERSLKVELLDVGGSIKTSAENLIRLPESFCCLPPLAYKCSLFGVSPLTHKWTKAAIATFKALTEYQSCIFEVKRTTRLQEGLFEVTPYEVQVLVKVEGVFHDVAHALAEEGLALKWNPTPGRPLVGETLDGELWGLLGAENDKPGQCLHSTQGLRAGKDGVMTREVKRMKKLLGRLNPDYDGDSSDEEFESSISSRYDDVLKHAEK